MMVLPNAIATLSTKCDQIPLIELQVWPPKCNAVMEWEDMVHLDRSRVTRVWCAANALRLTRQVFSCHFIPMGTAFNPVDRRDPGAMIGALSIGALPPDASFGKVTVVVSRSGHISISVTTAAAFAMFFTKYLDASAIEALNTGALGWSVLLFPWGWIGYSEHASEPRLSEPKPRANAPS